MRFLKKFLPKLISAVIIMATLILEFDVAKWCCLFLLLYVHIFPNLTWKKTSTLRNKILEDGVTLLQLFLFTTVVEIICTIWKYTAETPLWVNGAFSNPGGFLWHLAFFFFVEFFLFWNGIIRVYVTSVQLGIRWRVIGIVCGLIPIVHLWVLYKIIRICKMEVDYENEKHLYNMQRVEAQTCRTKYPLLMVHGVFFRDYRFFQYWGRIPAELKKNGATVHLGSQQSAASVASCGQELSERIRQIVESTGCEKVNIIAHSKGGLDSRYAISACGAAPYVASLTTINTPHRGCIFADYLLDNIAPDIQKNIAHKYNAALRRFGDTNPDFLEAVQDLTASACASLNEKLPDAPEVYYQSVTSKMNCAASGRFPMNAAYPLVKHFDGENDGLVAVESAKWGEHFTMLSVPKGRGISHGDVIDLNRENIPGFDVREFYVELVKDLKEKGY